MEYFPEGDLRRRIRAGVSLAEALELAAQIATALSALHLTGALHRDLKPGNVLMRSSGGVALTDFGLAKDMAVKMEITDPGLIFGTPHYMSPEQGHGEMLDARSDLYSLGVMLFEMLTGEKPFTDANPMAIIYKHRNQPVPRLPLRQAICQELVDRLLAKRPEDRFDSAAQAAHWLSAAARRARREGL
jgi:serine/threonine protein kinase